MAYSPAPVVQEISYLSDLTRIPCEEFRHFIVSGNKTDPLEYDHTKASEAHLFTMEGSAEHKAFDEGLVASRMRAQRYYGCEPEPDKPPNLCYVAANDAKPQFEALASSLGIGMVWGVLPVEKGIVRYTPDANLSWIVTFVRLRAFNPSSTLTATPNADMRSDDLDWNGFTNANINVQGNHSWGDNSVPVDAVFNVPVLFCYQGGSKVTFTVTRAVAPIASLPAADFQVHLAVHGYLAPKSAIAIISKNVTQVENHVIP